MCTLFLLLDPIFHRSLLASYVFSRPFICGERYCAIIALSLSLSVLNVTIMKRYIYIYCTVLYTVKSDGYLQNTTKMSYNTSSSFFLPIFMWKLVPDFLFRIFKIIIIRRALLTKKCTKMPLNHTFA